MVVDDRDGSITFLVQGQQPEMPDTAFVGARVALADVVFRVVGGLESSTESLTSIQVGSDTDPIYVSSLTSNGDDITKGQNAAQVRYLAHQLRLTPRLRLRPSRYVVVRCSDQPACLCAKLIPFAQIRDYKSELQSSAQLRLRAPAVVGTVASAPYVSMLSVSSLTGVMDTVRIPMTAAWSSPSGRALLVHIGAMP